MDEEKQKLNKRINIRVSDYEYNFIKGLSRLYAGGNVSLFMIWAAFNCNRKRLKEDELIKSKRMIRKREA